MKSGQPHYIRKQQHNSFSMRVRHPNQTSYSEIRAIQKLEIGRLTSARNFSHTLQTPPKLGNLAKLLGDK